MTSANAIGKAYGDASSAFLKTHLDSLQVIRDTGDHCDDMEFEV